MIVYNGKNLEDFGVTSIGAGAYGSPARDIEQIHVPGLNGDLLFDNGGYTNITVDYPDCCISGNFPEKFAALRTFLLADPGYHRLEDDYNPDEYRMAEFRGPLAPDVHTARGYRSGTFTLSFNAKPQRYLKEGAEEIEIQDWATIKNIWMPAYPVFKVKPGANGSCFIGFGYEYEYSMGQDPDLIDEHVTVTDNTGNTDMIYEIDMATGVAVRYEEGRRGSRYNAASNVSTTNGGVFIIPPGEHQWRVSGSGKAWVKPMWWRI